MTLKQCYLEVRKLQRAVHTLGHQLLKLDPVEPSQFCPRGQQILPAVLKLVCARFAVTPEQVLARNRESRVANARHLAVWLLYAFTGESKTDLAKLFRKDRGCVLNSIRLVGNLRQVDAEYDALCNELLAELRLTQNP